MTSAPLRITVLAALAAPALLAAPTEHASTRTALEQWIDLRKTISEEETAWKSDRETLRGTIDLLKAEIGHVDNAIKKANDSAAAAAAQRDKLAKENETLAQANAVVTDALGGLEATILRVAEFFPPDLRTRVAPQLDRLPKAGADARVSSSEHLQIVLSILGEAEKFDHAITVSRELQKLPNGDTVQVETLYLGLAVAFYVDGTGTNAGVLRPAKGAWTSAPDPKLASAIRRAIAVYRNDTPAVFVPLPVELQ